jgi:hypothetical protein
MSSAGELVPGSLWGLWDFMIKFDVRRLIVRMAHLVQFEKELRGHMPPEEQPNEPQMAALGLPMWTSSDPGAFTTDSGRKVIDGHIGPMRDELKPLGLSASQLKIQHIWNHADRWTRRQLADGFAALRWTIEQELNDKFFLYLNAAEAKLFDEEFPFGATVADAFPSATMDIAEAAKCLALSRNNAVIYHLMMAAEFGLRALAEDRQVEIVRQTGKVIPLEFSQWGQIIGELQKKIDDIQKWSPSSARAEAQQFYSDAILSVRSFNDGYRTHIAHGRSRRYQDDETVALVGHVRRFLTKLAEKISETKTMPLVWS